MRGGGGYHEVCRLKEGVAKLGHHRGVGHLHDEVRGCRSDVAEVDEDKVLGNFVEHLVC